MRTFTTVVATFAALAFGHLTVGSDACAEEPAPASPSSPAEIVEQAKDDLGGAQRDAAVARLRAIITSLGAKDDAAAAVLVGRAHFYLQEDRASIAAFKRAASLEPEVAEPVYWQGVVTQYSDVPKALVLLAKAAALEPEAARYVSELADLQRRAKRVPEAIASYRRVLELRPDDARAHMRLGNLLIAAKQTGAALEHLERSIALDGANPMARYNVAQTYYTQGQFAKALGHWQAGAKLAPDDFGMHKKVIQALYALGRHDEAGPHRERLAALRGAQQPVPPSFCFDQFKAGERRILAHERFDRTGDLVYHYVFQVHGAEGWERSINLESSAVLQELGVAYILGMSEKGGVHSTLGPSWKAMPPYEELKRAVIKAADGTGGGLSVRSDRDDR